MKKIKTMLWAIFFISTCFFWTLHTAFAENIDVPIERRNHKIDEEIPSRSLQGFPQLIAINENGEVDTGGEILPAAFTMLGRSDDTKVFVNNQEINSVLNYSISANSTLRITNLGIYEGKEIEANLRFGIRDRLSSVQLRFDTDNLWLWFNRPDISIINPTQTMTIEYKFSDGNALPEGIVLGATWGHSRNIHFEISQSSVKGIVVPTSDVEEYVIQSRPSNYLIEIINNTRPLTLLTPPEIGEYIFGIHSSPLGSVTGVIMPIFNRRAASVLPDNNSPSPKIEGIKEEKEFKSKYLVTQDVGSVTNGNYKLDVKYNTNHHKDMSVISIKDDQGNDLAKIADITYEEDGLAIQLSKEEMSALRSRAFVIELEGALDKDYSKLPDYLVGDYLEIPITAFTNYLSDPVSGNALTWARPWAESVPQEIAQGTSTADVSALDFVKNLENKLTDDTPFVVGFEEEKNFDVTGETSVNVVIESEISGIQNTIVVPVTVVESKTILNVEFINELDQLLPGYTIIIDNYQLGDLVDLTKEQQVIDQLNNLEQSGYEVVERPPNETSVALDSVEVTVQYKIQGTLRLASVPTAFDFGTLTYDATTQRVEDPKIDQPLIVTDMRAGVSSGWILTATLSTPMKNNEGRELKNALRYVANGKEMILDMNAQTVYSNTAGIAGTFNISNYWGTQAGTDGLKLQIDSSDILHTGSYTGMITWKIMAGQP